MFKRPDENRYIEDTEFIKNIFFINSFGVNFQNQTERPYISSTNVVIPDDFSFDNINNLYYLNDTIGRTEFIIFNKRGTYIDLIQYIYTGYDYDRSRTPKVQLRSISFNDTNNLFENYYNKSGLNLEEFFKMKQHLMFLHQLDIPSTYINVFKVPGFENKFKYSIINDVHKSYLNILKDNLCGDECNIYNYVTRINDESMMELAYSFLENYKIKYLTSRSYMMAR